VWRLAVTLPAMKTFLKQSELSAFRDSTQPHPVRNMIFNHSYIVDGFLMVHSEAESDSCCLLNFLHSTEFPPGDIIMKPVV
jgi:hypothetical protein